MGGRDRVRVSARGHVRDYDGLPYMQLKTPQYIGPHSAGVSAKRANVMRNVMICQAASEMQMRLNAPALARVIRI